MTLIFRFISAGLLLSLSLLQPLWAERANRDLNGSWSCTAKTKRTRLTR